jgi:hypothetical protein
MTGEFVSDLEFNHALLNLVRSGDVLLRVGPDGEYQFKLTEQGISNALFVVRDLVRWSVVNGADEDPGPAQGGQ